MPGGRFRFELKGVFRLVVSRGKLSWRLCRSGLACGSGLGGYVYVSCVEALGAEYCNWKQYGASGEVMVWGGSGWLGSIRLLSVGGVCVWLVEMRGLNM